MTLDVALVRRLERAVTTLEGVTKDVERLDARVSRLERVVWVGTGIAVILGGLLGFR